MGADDISSMEADSAGQSHKRHGKELPPVDKNSLLIVLAVSALVSFDYAPILLTLWPYFEALGGDYVGYNIVSAMYGLARIPTAPILSIAADYYSLKPTLLLCIGAFFLGNIVYVLASLFQGKTLALVLVAVARMLSGLGGSSVPVVFSYLTLISADEERVHYFNQFRIWQFLGNTVSPLIATICFFIPPGLVLGISLNAATIPALCTAGFAFILFTPTLMFFKEPPSDGERKTSLLLVFKSPALRDSLFLNLSFCIGLFTLCILTFQLIPISSIVFRIAYQNFKWIWVAYISFFVGFIISAILTKMTINKIPKFTDTNFMIWSPLMMAGGWFCFIQWSTYLPAWLYFFGSSLIFCGWGLFMVAHRAVYARATESSGYPTSFMALLSISGSIAMFLSPLFCASVLRIYANDDSSVVDECTKFTDPCPDSSQPSCCCTTSNIYCCCEMSGLTIASSVSIALLILATLVQLFVVYYYKIGEVGNQEDVDNEDTLLINKVNATPPSSGRYLQEHDMPHKDQDFHLQSDE